MRKYFLYNFLIVKIYKDLFYRKYIRKYITPKSQIYINYMFKNYDDSIWDYILNYNISTKFKTFNIY